jgi:hypothetical protein
MKTITVTHQNSINYGAVLQSYALQRCFSGLGVKDEIVDLKSRNKVFFREFRIGKFLASDIYNNIVNLLYVFETLKRVRRFNKFVHNNIKMTRHYRNYQEIILNPPVADVYVTGSDQTFNTGSIKKQCNFLKFGSNKTKRISYAASLGGQPEVSAENLNEFISDIRAYNFLSVREQCSADYISRICGVPCLTHIDPVFLLTKNEWSQLVMGSKLCSRIKQKKYILVYPLLFNPLLQDAVRKIKKDTELDVVVVNPNSRCFVEGDIIIRDAGPLEFLDLFENAAHIITTTFHGVCFSIIYEKQFFTFVSKKNEIRINSLLDALHLNERIVNEVDKINYDKITYDNVNTIIELERKKAKDYLVNALGI